MFRRCSIALLLSFALVACSKKEKAPPAAPPPAAGSAIGSAMEGTGSATGSADTAGSAAGSGSAAAAGSDSGSGSAAGSGDAAGSGSAGSAAAAGGETEFDKLSKEDKIKFMKTKVMPPMKAAFQKFDAKEFGNFTCKTCHGKDPQKSKYEMPSSDIPALDFEELKAGKDKEMAEFMSKVVKPEMAKILGEHEMTQEEPTGFGCLECHNQKKKK